VAFGRQKLLKKLKRCAEKRGYHWTTNTDSSLRFDAFIFRTAVIAALKVKKIRHAADENKFVENLFPEDVDALRSLPLPPHVLSELWIRTQKRAGMAPVLHPAEYHRRDRVQPGGGVGESSLPGR